MKYSQVWRAALSISPLVFPAGIVPQAAVEENHVSQECPEAAPIPAQRGEGKCDEEDKGNSRIRGNGKGLEDPTAQRNEGIP